MNFYFSRNMSENNIQATDLIDTTENQAIEDELEKTDDNSSKASSEQNQDSAKPTPEPVQVGNKSVKELTNEERSILIANAKNGQDNEFFKVAFDKSGRPKITKKKAPKQTNTAKIVEKIAPTMTTEQLLMEHVINLESQISALTQKHKNLKKKYKMLYEDVYIDDDSLYNQQQIQEQKQQEVQPEPTQQQQQPGIKRYGWRAKINPTF